jgi:hypothetical protein
MYSLSTYSLYTLDMLTNSANSQGAEAQPRRVVRVDARRARAASARRG